jgi:glutamate--cysteine ligase
MPDLRATVEAMFAPARYPGLVGVELELIPVTDTPLPRPVAPARLAAGFDAGFVRAAVPSFEPGGQLELSPPPRPTVGDLAADVAVLSRRVTAIAAARGIRLEAVGLNPYHSCADVPLHLPTPRYLAMQRAFDEVGPDGRRMMRLTASLQVAVDLLPGRAGHEQWLVASLAGPPLAAAFANSAVAAGRPAGTSAARTRIWLNADLRRTGYDGRHLDLTDPVGAYAAFARRHRGCPSGRLSSPPITCPRCSRRSGRAAGISRCATWTRSRCGASPKRSAPSPRSCTTTGRGMTRSTSSCYARKISTAPGPKPPPGTHPKLRRCWRSPAAHGPPR